jgi:hypothetical protein
MSAVRERSLPDFVPVLDRYAAELVAACDG